MPELPEVETVKNGLAPHLIGQKIHKIAISGKNMRRSWPENMACVYQEVIRNVTRRSKYLIIETDNHKIIFHLGMSGVLQINAPKQKHTHAILYLDNEKILCFTDPRRFGFMDIVSHETSPPYLETLGIEPLNNDLTPAYITPFLQSRKTNIKQFLFNQKIIVGLGNIYITESLFVASIHPTRPCASLTPIEIVKLLDAIRLILQNAIQQGGSSLKDYKNHDGKLGYFQHSFKAYGQKNQPCSYHNCAGFIEHFTQHNRSSYACNTHQK